MPDPSPLADTDCLAWLARRSTPPVLTDICINLSCSLEAPASACSRDVLRLIYWRSFCSPHRGVARNLFWRGTNRGTGDRSPLAGSRGRALHGGGPPEAEDIYANNHCNNVNQNPLFFQHGNFRGDMSPLPPPLPYAPPDGVRLRVEQKHRDGAGAAGAQKFGKKFVGQLLCKIRAFC